MGVEPAGVHRRDRVDDKPGQVVFGDELLHAGRQQERLNTIDGKVAFGHKQLYHTCANTSIKYKPISRQPLEHGTTLQLVERRGKSAKREPQHLDVPPHGIVDTTNVPAPTGLRTTAHHRAAGASPTPMTP